MLDAGTTGVLVAVALFGMLGLGVHIGVALGLAGIAGTYFAIGPDAAWAQLATIPFSTTNSFTLAVIPLFILMGSLATQAGLTTDLYRGPPTPGSGGCRAASRWRPPSPQPPSARRAVRPW
jgi:C4-dicarboxylate transporter DctM subunit